MQELITTTARRSPIKQARYKSFKIVNHPNCFMLIKSTIYQDLLRLVQSFASCLSSEVSSHEINSHEINSH